MQNDYSEFINGISQQINHKSRVQLGLTIEEYVVFDIIFKKNKELTYKEYWIECGLYPSEIRKILKGLKTKGFIDNKEVFRIVPTTFSKKISKKKNVGKIPFQESDLFDKKLFAAKFNTWNKEKLKYYWNAADGWSEEGGRKVNWYKTILNWATRDEKEGKLKFKEETTQPESNNFFANR